ncbi:MAG: TonB-dependent receptor [Bacteroidota bacterium]|nr:TonB-dependent receptor [Bacteroidota bacterium]
MSIRRAVLPIARRSAVRALLVLLPLVLLPASSRGSAQDRPRAAGNTLTGRTLTGRVTDATGMALTGANVIVRGTVLGSATDTDGRYRIQRVPAGPLTIVVSMIGYRKEERAIVVGEGETRRIDFELEETTLQTGEIIVTAGKHAQSFEEIPVSISTMRGADIEARGIETLDNALRRVPGVNITEDQVNIRGSSGYSRALGSRVLLLVDGAPVLAGDAGEIKFDVVPMFAVDRIEVVKGAGSALYGSSALGGVINVLTREPTQRITRVRLTSGFWDDPYHAEWKWWGESPRWRGGVDLQHGDVAGDFSYLLTAGVRGDQSYRQNDDFVRGNFSARGWYRFSPERNISVAVNHSTNDRGNWVYWRDLAHALQPPARADLSERIVSHKSQASIILRQTHRADFASSLRFTTYRTAFNTSSDTSDFSMRPSDQTQSTAWITGVEWQGTYALSRGNLLTFGADGQYSTVDSRTYGMRAGWSGAVYAQDELDLGRGWHLSAGARFDLTAIDTLEQDMQVNPRLGVTYTPWKEGTLRISHGWGFRSPSIAERFATASAGNLVTKPNPGLKAERSTSYEVGFRQLLPYGITFDGAMFWNDYDNLVEPTIDDGRIMFRNITRARIRGYELALEAQPLGDWISLASSYTYLYPQDLGEGGVLKYRPRHLLYLSADVHAGDFSIGTEFRHLSRIETIDRELTIVIPDAEQRVPVYVTDVRASWTGSAIGLPLRLSLYVDNVFQYNYTEVVANIAPIRSYRLSIDTAF